MMNKTKINILGTPYQILFKRPEEDTMLADLYGYTDPITKVICIDAKDYMNIIDNDLHRKEVLRHETIHAFLAESGLDNNAHKSDHWAIDEEIVDWLAIQGPKIYKVWTELNIL